MFMMMDDIGALIWRFARKLLATGDHSDEPDHASDHKPPPSIVHSPAAE